MATKTATQILERVYRLADVCDANDARTAMEQILTNLGDIDLHEFPSVLARYVGLKKLLVKFEGEAAAVVEQDAAEPTIATEDPEPATGYYYDQREPDTQSKFFRVGMRGENGVIIDGWDAAPNGVEEARERFGELAGAASRVRMAADLTALSAEEMARALEVFTRRGHGQNIVSYPLLDNYERKQIDKLVSAGYAELIDGTNGNYGLVASASELADAEVNDLIEQVMAAQAAVTRSEIELARIGNGAINSEGVKAALRTQRAELLNLQNRVQWVRTQRTAATKPAAPETPPAPVEAPYTPEKFYALLRKLGNLDGVLVARVPKFIRPALIEWLGFDPGTVEPAVFRKWAWEVYRDEELTKRYKFRAK